MEAAFSRGADADSRGGPNEIEPLRQGPRPKREPADGIIHGRLSPLVPRLNASTGASEEAGYEVTSLKFLSTIICTPGY